ncbi:formylglycine-generating enzyme family protein [bacterium]|nr:formylglycine-generating enzyme family protein [bacterium]
MRTLAIALVVTCLGHAAAGELPKQYTETFTSKIGKKLSFDMVLIPAGTFIMGSPEDEEDREKHEGPQRKVDIKPFYLATTETTFDLFMAYYNETMQKGKDKGLGDPMDEYKLATRWPVDAITGPTKVYGDLTNGWGEGKRPAIAMTWLNAMIFCKWLRKKTGKHYRLPTEAEWEHACRAGARTPYLSGDDPDAMEDHAWYEDTFDEGTEEAAKKKPNAFGLFDMQGNVREWVYDFYSPTAYAAQGVSRYANAGGPAKGKVHVARGGAYDSSIDELRSAARFFETEWWRAGDPQEPKSRWWLPKRTFIGFRVAREVE